jgi:DNA-binding transcriptional LysR family regulator
MQDLNDLYFFAEVVAHGGFAPAGRALRQPKSKLSRRVAQLEERLGVRLIERSTRRFRITEVGQQFYDRCRNVMSEVDQAEAVVAEAQGEPHGTVRFSCPIPLIEPLSRVLPDFMARHPKVKLHALVNNRPVDLIEERIDVAIRVRTVIDTDASLTMRMLAKSRRVLVASPALAERVGPLSAPEQLADLPTLSNMDLAGEDIWELIGPDDTPHLVRHEPRLSCGHFMALREAAEAGLGIALLPEHACRNALQGGRLVRLLPEFHAPEGTIFLVFTTRRGLPPAVRAFIDFLAEQFHGDALLANWSATQ